ncbi:ABC transporter permease [Nesterenkonia xinjiangensis]|uniref:NitT/TauT family transport system permease protein n=1 Tax=Nesterenkonia xinjiangensis TaxID=225327 RepID=A0A7Z0GMU8_9MICC|nr:ABC transporter permease [Nesterenkonia xinjiangensis]NYJ78900.1 NitT/TauT family transport system permease protein [Nesterenkonia xinjiangensis]
MVVTRTEEHAHHGASRGTGQGLGQAEAGTGSQTRPGGSAPDVADVSRGLDALETPGSSARRRLDPQSVLLPVAALAVVIVAWQLYVMTGHRRGDLVPGPFDVAATAWELWLTGAFWEAVSTSLGRGLTGFALSILIATPVGLIIAQVRLLRQAFGPLISGLQVLPSVAWVPAAIIWFGLTDATVYFVIFMGAIPSVVNGLIAGVRQVPPQHHRVGRVLGAGRWQMTTRILLPAILPSYVGGLRQGWAFSWRSLMAAEIIATGGSMGYGLGTLLDQGRALADMSVVLTAVLIILLVGVIVELLVFAPIERRLLKTRGLLER